MEDADFTMELSRRNWMTSVFGSLAALRLTQGPHARADEHRDIAAAVAKGRAFLVSLFDSELELLPEYRGANVYWLVSR